VIVRWTPIVAGDLTAIYDFIAQDNERAASQTIAQIIAAVEHLLRFPYSGREGRHKGTREMSQAPYVIVYRILEDTLIIDAILHSSRRF
jgi:addiction module RelE/StbE family toxin